MIDSCLILAEGANGGAKHLLTALTCFLSRKQMQVHTREAIKRKALIPICNCFSISTSSSHRAEVRQHFISSLSLSVSRELSSALLVKCASLSFFFPPPVLRILCMFTTALHFASRTANREYAVTCSL